jgi:hypothetical protein
VTAEFIVGVGRQPVSHSKVHPVSGDGADQSKQGGRCDEKVESRGDIDEAGDDGDHQHTCR